MCDTLVALPPKTQSGNLILGKNSDREPLEAQAIAHFPRQFPKEKLVKCTYISIPQVEQTYEMILSKPFQMWGAEMGVNEFGVCIGNEAIFTNVKFDKKNIGLTGMDLLRLALERSQSAKEALKTITQLLAKYGQNACGGYQNRNFYYHNSFLIADPEHAYILETAGKSWAYRKVSEFGSISNGLTIEENYDEAHFEHEKRTIQRFFAGKKESFRGRFSDLIYTTAGRAKHRQACTLDFLNHRNHLEQKDFFEALSQHDRADFDPKKTTTASICMHATGFTNPSDTTGSMVAEIRKNAPTTIWLTATPHPCMSAYVPFFLGETFDPSLLRPSSEYDPSLWWQAKKLQAKIVEDYAKNQPMLRHQLDNLQHSWLIKETQLIQKKASNSDFKNFTLHCLEEYKELINYFS